MHESQLLSEIQVGGHPSLHDITIQHNKSGCNRSLPGRLVLLCGYTVYGFACTSKGLISNSFLNPTNCRDLFWRNRPKEGDARLQL